MPVDTNPEPDRHQQEEQQKLFELLDRYVETLHREDVKSRSELLERHGELAGLLECLDSLDQLAPGRDSLPPRDDGAADAPTVVLSDAGPPAGSTGETTELIVPGKNDLPREFGKYQLLEEIGRGGMGVVYRARQTDLEREVALKMILSARLASDEEVRRFYAEARAAGGIRHPNIIGIHEVGQVHGQHYFAMDYVPGRSLAELLNDGPIEAEAAARIVASVAAAVDCLHERKIIHRDLKPSNILVDDAGTPYVTDFGLAKVFDAPDARTQSGTIVGTPSYMAPEQAAGRLSKISARSDVYSLGAILYELLCGRPPYQEKTPLDTLVQVLEGEPTLPGRLNRGIPRELELICMRCLEKDPQDRYQSAAALADDLQRYLRDEPVEAQPSGFGHRVRRWIRREPALVSRLAGLSVAAGVVQGTYMLDPAGVEAAYHWKIMGILGTWAVVSMLFQQMLNREALGELTRFAWCAADAAMLTILLGVTEGDLGPLLVAYPLLIAASGLFFQVRLVWFTTVACLVSYAALLRVHPEQAAPPHYHYPLIFAAVLAVLGFIVAYQVYRVRVLSRYYERRY